MRLSKSLFLCELFFFPISAHVPKQAFVHVCSLFPDEDRLSKRKSIGETISLQVEVESRNSPEKEEVRTKFHLGLHFNIFM